MVQDRQWCETGVHNVLLAIQCIYRRSDEKSENGDGKEGIDISGGGKRVKITWPLVCR